MPGRNRLSKRHEDDADHVRVPRNAPAAPLQKLPGNSSMRGSDDKSHCLLIEKSVPMMSQDRIRLVLVAVGLMVLLCASMLFPLVRYSVYVLLFALVCGVALLIGVGVILLILFNRGVAGPSSLSGTRCRACRARNAMQEVSREFLYGNVKVEFDHYRVVYCCSVCGKQAEQEEHVFPKQ